MEREGAVSKNATRERSWSIVMVHGSYFLPMTWLNPSKSTRIHHIVWYAGMQTEHFQPSLKQFDSMPVYQCEVTGRACRGQNGMMVTPQKVSGPMLSCCPPVVNRAIRHAETSSAYAIAMLLTATGCLPLPNAYPLTSRRVPKPRKYVDHLQVTLKQGLGLSPKRWNAFEGRCASIPRPPSTF